MIKSLENKKIKMITEEEHNDIEKNRDLAAFAYFLIFAPVLLYTRRDSAFVQFHAKQATVIFIFAIAVTLLPKPFSLINFLTAAIAMTGFLQANLGRSWKIPFVSQLLESGFSADSVIAFLQRILRTIGRIFTTAPTTTVRSASDAIAKMRGLDLNNLNTKIEANTKKITELTKEIENLKKRNPEFSVENKEKKEQKPE